MIRTIAAALAAFVFVAFGARAEEPKVPATSSDNAKIDTAASRKAQKKSNKKAKKAKKAAPADSAATPPAK